MDFSKSRESILVDAVIKHAIKLIVGFRRGWASRWKECVILPSIDSGSGPYDDSSLRTDPFRTTSGLQQ